MSIYHALINALSAHIIHINLNTIFYTPTEDGPTKTIYVRHYNNDANNLCKALYGHMHTQTHMTVAETGY